MIILKKMTTKETDIVGKTEKITGKETISDLLMMMPEAADIMAGFGLSCVNCGLSMYESLEKGVKVHNWKKERLVELLEELNSVWQSYEGGGEGVRVTNAARDAVYTLQKAENMEGYGLRIEAESMGEGEFSYFLDFEEMPSENDKVLRGNGIMVFADADTTKHLATKQVDYAGEVFVIRDL